MNWIKFTGAARTLGKPALVEVFLLKDKGVTKQGRRISTQRREDAKAQRKTQEFFPLAVPYLEVLHFSEDFDRNGGLRKHRQRQPGPE